VNIVVLTTGGLARATGHEAALAGWTAAGDSVTIVSMCAPEEIDRQATAHLDLGPTRVTERQGKAWRALARVWPGSAGRQLATRLRRSGTARGALDHADLVIGVEPMTAQALWWSSRGHPDVPHLVGLEHGVSASAG